jgi:hypothetical protein
MFTISCREDGCRNVRQRRLTKDAQRRDAQPSLTLAELEAIVEAEKKRPPTTLREMNEFYRRFYSVK